MGLFLNALSRSTMTVLGIGFASFLMPVLAQAQSPITYWKFDASSGTTAVDSSGNGHTATLVNGISWVAGHTGNAISATSAKSQYAKLSTLNLSSTQAVTVTFWSKRTYSTGGGHILFESTANYNNSTTGFGFFPDDNDCGGIQATLHGNSGYTAVCYQQPSSGVWHHFGVVYDKSKSGLGEVTLYIDGVLQTPSGYTYISNNTNNFGNNPLYLFSRGGTGQYDSGVLDEFQLFNSALSAAQVTSIFQAGSTGTCQLTATPGSITLPTVTVGSTATASGTLTNACSSNITISSAQASSNAFTLSGLLTPLSLMPGQSQNFTVSYVPTTATTVNSGITVLSNASGDPTLSIPLTATSAAAQQGLLTPNPTSLNFGSVTMNKAQTQTVTVTNTGSASVTVSGVAATGSGFSVGGMSMPVTLAAQQAMQVPVTFTPTATGSTAGTLTMTSNAQISTTTVSLSGTGALSSVNLSWADTGANIAGFNVYRSTVSGSNYTKLNTSLLSSPSYSDQGVTSGSTYFYVTTAIGQNGLESVYSNQASATVP